MGLPIKLAISFLIIALMIPVISDVVENTSEDLELLDLQEDAMELSDALSSVRFSAIGDYTTYEVSLEVGDSLTLGNNDDHLGMVIGLHRNGVHVGDHLMDPSVMVTNQDTLVLSGTMSLKIVRVEGDLAGSVEVHV